jgi:hypothetical protein
MATIRKTSSGRFRAILRDCDGRHLEPKTFTLKGDAREWAKRMEADKERMIALGTAGARLILADVIDVYLRDWDGRDQREGFVVVGLTSSGHRLYEPLTLNAHEAGELARALAAALHAVGRVS